MTTPHARIDMTTGELHHLIKPVLPHACTDAEVPEICVIRLECTGRVVYAVATDRYTLAATRHELASEPGEDFTITIDRADAANMLRLFRYDKDDDPELRITAGQITVRSSISGVELYTRGLTVESEDGTRLVLQNRRDGIGNWRKQLGQLVHRELAPASDRIMVMPGHLARWTAAASKGERIVVFTGPDPGSPLLILVEDRFAGAWMPAIHIDGDSDALLYDSSWRTELPATEATP